jgi:hypothetical protein
VFSVISTEPVPSFGPARSELVFRLRVHQVVGLTSRGIEKEQKKGKLTASDATPR